jgi:pimeloyl-ACP methyl ester carboxylesterase
MMPLLNQRQKAIKLSDLTFANVALSERLTENPLRFFRSGRQSAEDIVDLLQTIKQGKHQLFEPNTQVDFFAYSIGAFLAQILFLANPKSLLSSSKLFLFCGGARFSEMFGTSRLIMDSQAFISLRKYYLGDFLKELKSNSPFSEYIMKSQLGHAFQAMLAPDNLKSFREDMLQKLSNQVRVIALKKDKVIPAKFIRSTFACIKHKVKGIVEVFDFPYDYSHEMPFPILNSPNNLQVDQSFERVFNSAVEFLK